jgi:hypothetical protein
MNYSDIESAIILKVYYIVYWSPYILNISKKILNETKKTF